MEPTAKVSYIGVKIENIVYHLEKLIQEAWQDGYDQARKDLNLEL